MPIEIIFFIHLSFGLLLILGYSSLEYLLILRDIKEQRLLLPHYMQAIEAFHSAHLLRHQTLQKNAVGCFHHQVSH